MEMQDVREHHLRAQGPLPKMRGKKTIDDVTKEDIR